MRARRVVAGVFALLGAGLLALAAGIAAFIARPEWFPTTAVAGRALRVFGRAWRPSWDGLTVEFRSRGLREKDATITARGLCFPDPAGRASGCVAHAEARLSLRLSRRGATLTRVSGLDVEMRDLTVDRRRIAAVAAASPRAGAGPPASTADLTFSAPAFLRGVRIDGARVALDEFELVEAGARTRGTATARWEPGAERPLRFESRWQRSEGRRRRRGRVWASAASDALEADRATRVDLRAGYESGDDRLRFAADARGLDGPRPTVTLDAAGRAGAWRGAVRASGDRDETRWLLAGDGYVASSTGPLRALRFAPFSVSAPRRGSGWPTSARLEADLAAQPAFSDAGSAKGLGLPGEIEGLLTVDFRLAPLPKQRDRFEADVALRLRPYKGKDWYQLDGGLDASLAGRLSEPKALSVRSRASASAEAPRFEELVSFLAKTPYAVPAPFAALKGKVRLEATATGDPRSGRQDLTAVLRTDLAAGSQRFRTRVTARAEAERGRPLHAAVDAVLEDAALQVPHLDALKLPQATLDSRIVTKRDKALAAEKRLRAASPSPFVSTGAYSVEGRLTTASPLILRTDLARSPVPVTLDLRAGTGGAPPSGFVELRSFQVEFFRRLATVDHARFTRRPGAKAAELDGLVVYDAGEATIRILLLGTSDKPRLEFESDPPMTEDAIVSLLLFGKSPNELDADQSSTLAFTRSAIADKAFGLASLYLFASTPIQFVGYDPSARAYTMRFNIPGGQTLEVNSGLDQTKRVQLRKRLTAHLAIQAQARSTADSGGGITTFLEWFTRY